MTKHFFSPRVSLVLLLTVFVMVSNARSQDKPAPQVSEAEAKAATSIETAADAAGKLTAATGFVGKYPKSALRQKIVEHVGVQITLVRDPAEKMRLAEQLQQLFQVGDEIPVVRRVMIDAYASADKLDDAFALATTALAAQPEDVFVLSRMTFASTEAAKRQNPKFVATGSQYGAKAIELIEANKKPLGMDDAGWASQKSMLPRLYQDTGILSLVARKMPDAKSRFEKAVSLDPNDPMNHAMMATIYDEEYQDLVEKYRGLSSDSEKPALMKRINEQLDKVIDSYAHTIGLAIGRPEYQPLMNQALQNLTPYYKYRHNNSTDGMQALIDKYKPAAKP